MKLSLLVCVAENDVILEDINEGSISYWSTLAAHKPLIISQNLLEVINGNFSTSQIFVVNSGGTENTVSIEETLAKLKGEDEVFILCDDVHIATKYWDKYENIYLTRIHRDFDKKTLFPFINCEVWSEVSRTFKWEDGKDNSSHIIYQRNNIDLEMSVIISTCNQSAWLQKTLWGYEAQTTHEFELIIADDGSRRETYDMIEAMRSQLSYTIKHVWHEDKGFRKCDILNKAILASGTNYLLFSDGDCIPRKDFVAVHLNNRKKGYFLSGGYHKLSLGLSELLTSEDILTGRCFDLKWLKDRGMKSSFRNNKLDSFGFKSWLLNTVTTTKPTWNGHNASGWLNDILAVNGFDERMQYGGQDREFGERMVNLGIRGKQIRYSTVCVHLDHSRGYKTVESIQKNVNIRKHTRKSKVITTPYGINCNDKLKNTIV